MFCFNCSPFYRRKTTDGANPPASLPSAEACEESSRRSPDELRQSYSDEPCGWSNADSLSSVAVNSITTESTPAVDSSVYGHEASSSRWTVTTDSNSSVAASPVPNSSTLLCDFTLQHVNIQDIQGGPQKVSHYQMIKKWYQNVLKPVNKIRFISN